MSVLRNKIIASAERLFAEKGYDSTSIQDIADDCSIAKGSLYKFFSSKEDLYIEILEERQLAMIEQTERIHDDASLSPQELFLEEIAFQLDFFLNHGFFISNSRGESLPVANERIGPLILRKRAMLLNYNRRLLLRRYGAALEPHSWDAVVILNAMAKEYLHLIKAAAKPLSVRGVAVFLARRMDDVVAGLLAGGEPPLLPAEIMQDFEAENPESLRETAARCGKVVFEQAHSTIRELNVPNARKRELEQVLGLLEEEAATEAPRRFLVMALLADLGAEHELAPYAARMRLWAERLLAQG